MKPYSFEAVYPVEQIIDVGRRAAAGEVNLELAKDVTGCIGCVLEKLDGVEPTPGPFGATPDGVDLDTASVEELGETLKTCCQTFGATEDGQDAEVIPPFVWPILIQLATRLFERLFKK